MRHLKVKRWGVALGLLSMGLASGAWAQAVTLVLRDGSVLKGDLLGIDRGTLTLEKAGGKSEDIPVSRIRKAFDAEHRVVSLRDSGTEAAPAADQTGSGNGGGEPASDVVPSRHGRRDRRSAAQEGSAASHRYRSLRGRKVTGEVLFWSGVGVTVVGLGAMLYGGGQESSATSYYYSQYGLTNNYDYADYTISGYPGYYTYSQYSQYTYGQAWIDGGLVIGIVGIGCMLAGAIITPNAREMQNASLLNYSDHELSLGLPQMGLTRFGGPKASLFSATF